MSDKSVPWSDVSDLEKERDALKAQLAEVTRENLVLLELAGKEHIDRTLAQAELRAERAKLSENIEAERELRKIAVGIERAKAEGYRAALEIYSRAICHSCAAEHGAPGQAFELPNLDNEIARKALSEAEGE